MAAQSGPPPEGANLEACTIREVEGSPVLLCGGDLDLEETNGELLGDALACQLGGSASADPDGVHGFVNRLFEPFAGFVEVSPLYANPGALGLKSSFTSPFGVTFAEGSISGTVLESDNETVIPGATVVLEGDHIVVASQGLALSSHFPDSTITADQNGDYSFAGLPFGSYRIIASAEGFVADTLFETLGEENPDATDVDFNLEPTSAGTFTLIQGQVLDGTSYCGSGAFVGGAQIEATHPETQDQATGTSNAQGEYSVAVFPTGQTTYEVVASMIGFVPDTTDVTVTPGTNETGIDFCLQPAPSPE